MNLLPFLLLLGVCFAIPDYPGLKNPPSTGATYAEGWHYVAPAHSSDRISLLFALKHPEGALEKLESVFKATSYPNSPEFRQWLSFADVASITRVAEADKLVDALVAFGIPSAHVELFETGDFVRAAVTVKQIEEFLKVSLWRVAPNSKSECDGCSIIRATGHYSLPEELDAMVEFVAGLYRVPNLPLKRVAPKSNDQPTTPQLIWKRYNVSVGEHAADNKQAVVSFLDQYYSPSDLETFQNKYDLPVTPIAKTIGPNDPDQPGMEATLDVQYLQGVSQVATWVWSTGGTLKEQEPFLHWLAEVSARPHDIKVFSISYQDLENTRSAAYMDRVNFEFLKLSTMGVSLVTGSGDWGTQCDEDTCDRFIPDFPSSSPYITSLGATALSDGVEEGVSWSSGGFSEHFISPEYQAAAVEGFLNRTKTPVSYFNPKGRAFPDLSTIGVNFQVYMGSWQSVGGTSAATPTFAAMISLLNDQLMQKKGTTVGCINPFLYWAAEQTDKAFYDVLAGNNKWGCCTVGFDATLGWDAITGLGTPNFEVLKQLALSL